MNCAELGHHSWAYLGFSGRYGPLDGRQASRGDARHGPLGGEGRGWVQGRAVPERRAHDARRTAHQLLVHLQCHRGGRVGETQCRTGGGRHRIRVRVRVKVRE